MGGVGSGPQKTPATLIKEAKEFDAKNLPAYFERLSRLALDGDSQALFYLIDRHLGKAKTTMELEGTEELGVGVVVKLFQKLEERRRELERIDVKEVTDGQHSQGEDEALP